MRSAYRRSQARHGARQRLCASPLSAPTLVGFVLLPQALAASADGPVNPRGLDYALWEWATHPPLLASRLDLNREAVVRRVASVGLFHRAKRVIGRAKHLQGQCYVFAAHLYQTAQKHWASALVGALLYVKGRSIPRLVGDLAQQLRLPAEVRHVWVVDRGIVSRPLVQSLERYQYVLGRVRSNQVFYFAPRRQPKRGRPRSYGQKCRVDKLVKRFPERLQHQTTTLKIRGKERTVRVYDAEMLWRGVWPDRPCPVRLIVVVVPGLRLKPWYLLTTDLALTPLEAIQAYGGRQQIEVNFDEVKELGLGHYQGRSSEGVRRWPIFLCIAQTLLKLIAVESHNIGYKKVSRHR